MPNEKGQVLMAPSGSAPLQEWAFTGGRGLGGKVDADGNLILCHVPMVGHLCSLACPPHLQAPVQLHQGTPAAFLPAAAPAHHADSVWRASAAC